MAQLTKLITRNGEFAFFTTNFFGGQTSGVTGMGWDSSNPLRLLVGTENGYARSYGVEPLATLAT